MTKKILLTVLLAVMIGIGVYLAVINISSIINLFSQLKIYNYEDVYFFTIKNIVICFITIFFILIYLFLSLFLLIIIWKSKIREKIQDTDFFIKKTYDDYLKSRQERKNKKLKKKIDKYKDKLNHN